MGVCGTRSAGGKTAGGGGGDAAGGPPANGDGMFSMRRAGVAGGVGADEPPRNIRVNSPSRSIGGAGAAGGATGAGGTNGGAGGGVGAADPAPNIRVKSPRGDGAVRGGSGGGGGAIDEAAVVGTSTGGVIASALVATGRRSCTVETSCAEVMASPVSPGPLRVGSSAAAGPSPTVGAVLRSAGN